MSGEEETTAVRDGLRWKRIKGVLQQALTDPAPRVATAYIAPPAFPLLEEGRRDLGAGWSLLIQRAEEGYACGLWKDGEGEQAGGWGYSLEQALIACIASAFQRDATWPAEVANSLGALGTLAIGQGVLDQIERGTLA